MTMRPNSSEATASALDEVLKASEIFPASGNAAIVTNEVEPKGGIDIYNVVLS